MVSNVAGIDIFNVRLATFQICTSPKRPGLLAARHLWLFACLGRDLPINFAFFGSAGHDTEYIVFGLLEQLCKARHHVASLGHRGLMTSLAMLLNDRPNVLVIADRLGNF